MCFLEAIGSKSTERRFSAAILPAGCAMPIPGMSTTVQPRRRVPEPVDKKGILGATVLAEVEGARGLPSIVPYKKPRRKKQQKKQPREPTDSKLDDQLRGSFGGMGFALACAQDPRLDESVVKGPLFYVVTSRITRNHNETVALLEEIQASPEPRTVTRSFANNEVPGYSAFGLYSVLDFLKDMAVLSRTEDNYPELMKLYA